MFSLLDEPWIACVDIHGKQQLLSMREVFDGSCVIKELRGDSPAQDYAVLRVLLAVFWRAHQQPQQTMKKAFSMAKWFSQMWDQANTNQADNKVLKYLEEYEHRFNLLDSDVPFMQVADLHTASGAISQVQRIVPEAEAEFFTMRAGAARDSLSFAEAARWLIYVHAYDYSGIKSGAVGDARVKGGKGYPIGTGWTGMTGGTVVKGDTLAQTLVLNTTEECLRNPSDKPVWERQPDTAAERNDGAITIGGAADLATWQTRRVRLHHDDNRVTGVLVSNGDRIPNAGLNVFGDPMTPYRFSTDKSKKDFQAFYPKPYDEHRTMWQSIEPLIAMESDAPYLRGASSGGKNFQAPKRPQVLDQLSYYWDTSLLPRRIMPISMVSVVYGPRESSVANTLATSTSINPTVLEDTEVRRSVLDSANVTVDAAIALGQFAGNLLVAAGGEYAFVPTPTDAVLARLETEFDRWLQGWTKERNAAEYCGTWQQTVEDALIAEARLLLESAGPRAMIGRPDPRSSSEKPPIVTAASYFSQFKRRVRSILPLLDQPVVHAKEKTNDH